MPAADSPDCFPFLMSSEPTAHVTSPAVAANSNGLDFPTSEMDWREYLFFREEMRHEDNLINQRVSWLIGSQAFLLGAFATLVNATGNTPAPSLDKLKGLMVEGLPIAGILAVLAGYSTILAAVIHVNGIRRYIQHRQCRQMPSLYDWHLLTRRMGMIGPLVTPLIFVAFWIVVLAKMG